MVKSSVVEEVDYSEACWRMPNAALIAGLEIAAEPPKKESGGGDHGHDGGGGMGGLGGLDF